MYEAHVPGYLFKCRKISKLCLDDKESCFGKFLINWCLYIDTWARFYLHGLTLIPAWISNYTHYNVWDEITYPFLNFNGATVEV